MRSCNHLDIATKLVLSICFSVHTLKIGIRQFDSESVDKGEGGTGGALASHFVQAHLSISYGYTMYTKAVSPFPPFTKIVYVLG